ncbi:MAG: hypothetical protein IIU58_01620 [Clostridia bacterium]|nr:hypothetical protein [Clostridia bacterium]
MIRIQIGRQKKKRTFSAFSKKALLSMIILWFFGALFAFAVVTLQVLRGDMTVQLADLLLYIGAPMTGGIVSYMIKSAWEKKKTEAQATFTEDNSI